MTAIMPIQRYFQMAKILFETRTLNIVLFIYLFVYFPELGSVLT